MILVAHVTGVIQSFQLKSKKTEPTVLEGKHHFAKYPLVGPNCVGRL